MPTPQHEAPPPDENMVVIVVIRDDDFAEGKMGHRVIAGPKISHMAFYDSEMTHEVSQVVEKIQDMEWTFLEEDKSWFFDIVQWNDREEDDDIREEFDQEVIEVCDMICKTGYTTAQDLIRGKGVNVLEADWITISIPSEDRNYNLEDMRRSFSERKKKPEHKRTTKEDTAKRQKISQP